MDHGVHAQHHVEQDLNPEAEHAHLEMLVELNVLDLSQRHDRVVVQSSTHDGEDTEPGEHAQQNVDPEFSLDHDLVLPETLAELDAQDHQLKPEPVEWLLSTP